MAPVKAIIPATPEADCMVTMMNKNFPAYVFNVLKDHGLPNNFYTILLLNMCDPTMVAEMGDCQ